MGLVKKEFLNYMKKFDDCPFEMEIEGERNLIGTDDHALSIIYHKTTSKTDMKASTSVTLGEAYMDRSNEIK